MAEKEGQSPRNMDISIDEDVHSDADENGLNSSSGSETETQSKKARMQTSSPNLFPPGFMVAGTMYLDEFSQTYFFCHFK